jgi:hypothetical protein
MTPVKSESRISSAGNGSTRIKSGSSGQDENLVRISIHQIIHLHFFFFNR